MRRQRKAPAANKNTAMGITPAGNDVLATGIAHPCTKLAIVKPTAIRAIVTRATWVMLEQPHRGDGGGTKSL